MSKKPEILYRVAVVPTKGKRLRYGQRGGGTFSSLANMQYRIDDLNRAGVEYEIYESEPIIWKKIGGSEKENPLLTDMLPFEYSTDQ